MSLLKRCAGVTLCLGLGTVYLSASCDWPTYPSCSWSILNLKGANIKGLILTTNKIIYKYWNGRYDPNIKQKISVDEINTLIDFIAAMECENYFKSVPSGVYSLSQILKENLNSLCVRENAYLDVDKRKEYYEFFYKNPYVDNEKEMDQTYLDGVNRWCQELKQRQEEESHRFQYKQSSGRQQAAEMQRSQDNHQSTVRLQELINSMTAIQTEVERLHRLIAHLVSDLSAVVGTRPFPSTRNDLEPTAQNISPQPEGESQETK